MRDSRRCAKQRAYQVLVASSQDLLLGERSLLWDSGRVESDCSVLNDDGTVYRGNLRTAEATDSYICKGEEVEIFEPHFTFHGFQYVEVTGFPIEPTTDAITGIVVHANLESTGSFSCSYPLINQLQSNILWGQKGNFLEVPTDCPQRDERLGWTGDAQIFIRTASFNMDVAAFFEKWLFDLCDDQLESGAFPVVAPNAAYWKDTPPWKGDPLRQTLRQVILGPEPHRDGGVAGWAEAGIICPWVVYEHFGDSHILREHNDSMVSYIEYLEGTSNERVRPFLGYGDWLTIDTSPSANFLAPTPQDLIGTAYFAYACDLMKQIAGVLDKPEDEKRFAELAESVREAFNREFVSPGGRILGDTQTCYLLALGFDLLPEELRAGAFQNLLKCLERRAWHLSTGFLGTPLLCPVLSRFGRTDVAYRLLLNEGYPSWLYPVKNGATTMWERWNSWTKENGFGDEGMNSFNHYAYGTVGEWIYTVIAGIDQRSDSIAFQKLRIHPQPSEKFSYAKGQLKTPYGTVRTHWRIAEGTFYLDLEIPANSDAHVRLPRGLGSEITESDRSLRGAEGVSDVKQAGDSVVFELGSGCYRFQYPYPASSDAAVPH